MKTLTDKRALLLAAVLISIMAAVMVGASACDDKDSATGPEEKNPFTDIAAYGDVTPEVAKTLVDTFEDDNRFVVLDVRTPGEYDAGHIEGAVNIDFYADDFPERVAALDSQKTYLVYCRSGNRSSSAAYKMKEQGKTNYYNMTGGFNDWKEAGYPVSD